MFSSYFFLTFFNKKSFKVLKKRAFKPTPNLLVNTNFRGFYKYSVKSKSVKNHPTFIY